MTILNRAGAALFYCALSTGVVQAEAYAPVDLDPIMHLAANLEVVGPNGAQSYDPAALEALGAVQMTTLTPWTDEPAVFEGVLLSELLDQNGLSDVQVLRFTAENDYSTSMPRTAWEDAPIMVATRMDGRALTHRDRGPFFVVMPMEVYESSDTLREGYWVWMVKNIEVEH